jgi:L-ribulokinase
MNFALGIDLGTGTARAAIVDCATGVIVGIGSADYASGTGGVLYDLQRPLLARQCPGDNFEAIEIAVEAAIVAARATQAKFDTSMVTGIGVDATASTPIPVDAQLRPLAFDPAFAGNLDALAWLWKDHEAHAEAAEITALLRTHDPVRLEKVGNAYSSEWYWAKLLRCARVAPQVFAAAASWLELCDLIPAWLCGIDTVEALTRGIGSAGHKGLYLSAQGGWPAPDLLHRLDPRLMVPGGRVGEAGEIAGRLDAAIAARLGLVAGTPVSVGGIDAHVGAIGAGVRPGRLVKIMGTSCCDITVGGPGVSLPAIDGMSGVVTGSVLPGHDGLEAGQAAIGDLYGWAAGLGDGHVALSAAAAKLAPGASGLVALDWNNGNRCVLGDTRLTGLMLGQTLRTTPAEIYRAMIEATGFGARKIIDRIVAAGVEVDEVVMCGGVAERNPLVPRIFADILERPIGIAASTETCALGAAILGAVCGGAHPDVPSAQAVMVPPMATAFTANSDVVGAYRALGGIYDRLHNSFGTGALADIMPALGALRDSVRTQPQETPIG